LNVMKDLQEWAAARRARGGAPIKVRVGKGANLAMERVDAAMHGWDLTTWDSKQSTDANYVRVLDWAMHPDRIQNVN
ncbi:proline dehydrogenase family protein, partial [Streptococcus anginosus]|nr:proline dehydrogenase family protein [Streptococcus anginosus]